MLKKMKKDTNVDSNHPALQEQESCIPYGLHYYCNHWNPPSDNTFYVTGEMHNLMLGNQALGRSKSDPKNDFCNR